MCFNLRCICICVSVPSTYLYLSFIVCIVFIPLLLFQCLQCICLCELSDEMYLYLSFSAFNLCVSVHSENVQQWKAVLVFVFQCLQCISVCVSVPSENVATMESSACVIEGVSRSRNALINGDTKNYDWDSGYTCHQLGSGSIVVQLAQPYVIGSMRCVTWQHVLLVVHTGKLAAACDTLYRDSLSHTWDHMHLLGEFEYCEPRFPESQSYIPVICTSKPW